MRLGSLFDDFRAWRERRAAMSELNQINRDTAELDKPEQERLLSAMRVSAGHRDAEAVMEAWDRLYTRWPDYAVSSLTALHSMREVGKFELLEDIVKQSLARFPGAQELMYFWASLAEHRADRAEAVARWRKVSRAFPRSVDAVFGFGRACKAAGQMADAEAAFRRGTQIAPENPVPRLEYARMAEGREDWEGALQRYEAMQAAVRHVGGWTGAAACLRKLGRDDEAIELLEQACLKFDTRWEPLIALGRIARDHGDLERAAAHFQKAARNFPQSEEAALGAAEVLRELGRMDEADAILGSYANRREAGWGGVLAYARSAHGRDWPEAARRWALVRAKFPNRPEGYALGADALERAGEKEEADRIRASKPASG